MCLRPACNYEKVAAIATSLHARGVPRVIMMWTPKEAGGLGAALSPPMGPGRSPGGGPGGEAPVS